MRLSKKVSSLSRMLRRGVHHIMPLTIHEFKKTSEKFFRYNNFSQTEMQMRMREFCLRKQTNLLQNDVVTFYYKNKLIRFYLPKSYLDLIQTYISYNECFFEQELLERVSFLYSFKNKKVFDIGANIGNHTLYFSKFCQAASVISFEPQQEAFAILEKNIALNECKNVVAYNWALG